MKKHHIIKIGRRKLELPACWEAMDAPSLEFLARHTLGGTTPARICLLMALRCMGAQVLPQHRALPLRTDVYRVRLAGSTYPLTAAQLTDLAQLLSWLITEEPECEGKAGGGKELRIRPEVERCPYPTLEAGGTMLHGPADGLLDICFEQYIYLYTYVQQMRADGSYLHHVIATVWHSAPSWSIDRLEADAALIARLPDERKVVMLWFVQTALQGFADMFPRLFSGGGKAGGNAFDRQMRLLDSLAGGDMTRKDAVRRGSLIGAFYSMDEAVRRKEEEVKRI